MTIELDDAIAAILWDICDQLDNNKRDIGFLIREAVVAKPKLEEALATAGYNEFAIRQMQRPPIPKLRLGDKYVAPDLPIGPLTPPAP